LKEKLVDHSDQEAANMIRFSTSLHRPAVVSAFCAVGLLTVLMPLWSVPASAGAEMSAEAKALVKLDDDWSAAAATRDAKRVASFYAEDAIAYPPNEPAAVGKAAAEKVWAAYFVDPSYNLSWKTMHAEVTGVLGYTAGTYEDSFKGPDGKKVQGKGKYLCVWKKQGDGTWKAIHDMWNADSK
jgi:ketosteroid isomerase-like protein